MPTASYPEFHVTGPVHHWVRVPGNAAIYYLGTAEVTPKVELRPFWKDVFNDIGGRSVPMQKTEDGEMAVVGVLLNRYSKVAYDALEKLGASQGQAGWRSRFSRGRLAFGNNSFELWQVFENATDEDYRSTGLEMGYYWPQCLLGGHTRDTLGSEVEKLLMVVEAYPYWVPQSSIGSITGNARSWQLFRKDDAAFPADVRVPQ